MNELDSYEHPLFIAVADWLRDGDDGLPDSIAEWIPDSLVKSLPPSVMESLRVSMEVDQSSKLLRTKIPPPSLAAQFEAELLPAGAYLAEPKVPDDLEYGVPPPSKDTPTSPNIERMKELCEGMKDE